MACMPCSRCVRRRAFLERAGRSGLGRYDGTGLLGMGGYAGAFNERLRCGWRWVSVDGRAYRRLPAWPCRFVDVRCVDALAIRRTHRLARELRGRE